MKQIILFLMLFTLFFSLSAQAPRVTIEEEEGGVSLLVDGEEFMINGMNWDYFPIGSNYSYSLWTQPDDFIREALDHEMSMLRNMGVNTIRVYTGITKKWVEYIYDTYGIYTMLNHSFGRYGLTLDGAWYANTEYSDPRVRELLLREVTQMVEEFRDTRGLLFYLLGNENNYGLFWEGAETEDIPMEDRVSTQRARHMYKLFNEAALEMKAIDSSYPVALCNGDLLFLDIIAEECQDVDIFGVNIYRGVSFTDAFDRVKNEYGKPMVFTEFGADAFNAVSNQEDQSCQAYYLLENWKEIYENAAGMGKAGNSIGGFTFQFSDGWWKYGQTTGLDVHDTHASWSNGGYQCDYVEGENNMNEEWFGICAKGPTNERGLYQWTEMPFKELEKVMKEYEESIRSHYSKEALKDDGSSILGKPIGRAALLQRLRFEFIPYTPEELIAIGEQQLEWCRKEMMAASREMGFGENWHAALEHVKDQYVAPGDQPAMINHLAEEAIAFIEYNDLLTIPELAKETWRMEMMTPEAQRMNPFFLGGESIIISFPTHTMSHEAKLMSLRGNNPHFCKATVHHELIAGHHLQGFMNQRFKPYRRPLSTPFWLEGWPLNWEFLLYEMGLPEGPEDRMGFLFWRKHRAARIIFSLKYHLGQMSPQECIDFLVEEVGHERANAEAEVRRSFMGRYDPLYQLAYMIGGIQFQTLSREMRGHGRTFSEFHDEVMRQNNIPLELLRMYMLQVPLTRDFSTSWRFAEGYRP